MLKTLFAITRIVLAHSCFFVVPANSAAKHLFGIGGKGDFLAILDLWLFPVGFYFGLSGDCLLFGSFGN